MITTEIKQELFKSNISVIEEILQQLKQDIANAKEHLENKDDSIDLNLNGVIGALLGMPHKLKQIEDINNVLKSVHRL